MRRYQPGSQPKGWFEGPWNTGLSIGVGYANAGIDEPHLHKRLTEIYLVARGQSRLRVERAEIELNPGEMVVIEPGEAHTFVFSTPDYYHFVLHVPAPGQSGTDKVPVPPERLASNHPESAAGPTA